MDWKGFSLKVVKHIFLFLIFYVTNKFINRNLKLDKDNPSSTHRKFYKILR